MNRRTFGLAASGALLAGCSKPAGLAAYLPAGSADIARAARGENAIRFAQDAAVALVRYDPLRFAIYGIDPQGELVELDYSHTNTPAYTFGTFRVTRHGRPEPGLGGPLAAVSWAPFQYGVFAMAKDDRLWGRVWLGNRWAPWENWGDLPEPLTSICGVSWAEWRYGVYGIGKSGNLYEKYWTPGNPGGSAWSSLGHPSSTTLAGSVTAASWVAGQYAVFALGADGAIWEKTWLTTHWTEWTMLPSPNNAGALLQISMADSSTNLHRPMIFAVGHNGMHLRWRHGAIWSPWEPAPAFNRAPIAAGGAYAFECMAVYDDGHVLGLERDILHDPEGQPIGYGYAWKRLGTT